MTTMRRRLPLLAFTVVSLGCSMAPAGPDKTLSARTYPHETVGPAILSFYGDVTTVTVPESARVGESVQITATSFGGGCVSDGGTEASVSGLVADVHPLRVENDHPNAVCTMELKIFVHTTVVQFSEPGDALVRVTGIERPGDTPFVVERRLTVLP